MAERFAAAGGCVAFGRSPAARSDARHVAVEFVHPVIVGKRALPALALCAARAARSRAQVELLARAGRPRARLRPAGAETAAALARARRGCLTIGFDALGATARSGPLLRTPPTRSCARSSSRRSTTCCGSSCTSSSSTAGCSRDARSARVHDAGAAELPLPVPGRAGERPRRGRRRRPPLDADEGGRDRARCARRRWATTAPAARAAAAACAPARRGRARCWRSATAARRPTRWTSPPTCASRPSPAARAPRARPHRGRGDPDRGRERHRHRRDLLAPGDRLRARRGRAAGALDERQLARTWSRRWARRAGAGW